MIALFSKLSPCTDAFQMVRKWSVCLGFGMAATGTTLNGTVERNYQGPSIHPSYISLGTLSAKAAQCLYTEKLCDVNQ